MGQYGIGQGIKRVEDVRLLRGRGRYLDDVNMPGQTHAVIVRSVHAHARIRELHAARYLEHSAFVRESPLGAHDSLRDGRFRREEGSRDLLRREPAQQPEGERDPRLGRKDRVAGREHQP